MNATSSPKVTLIGGPTAIIEVGSFRLITDPTFDGPGEYRLPHVTLTKLGRPALTAREIGPIDAVLLSHDQHSDNLDNAGRALLSEVPRVLTTVAGAKRLAGRSEGLLPWETRTLTKPDGTPDVRLATRCDSELPLVHSLRIAASAVSFASYAVDPATMRL